MMDLLRWMGWMFARFVAVSVTLVSGWMLLINLVEKDYEGWVLAWILASGAVGTAGGLVYLLSIDGPARLKTHRNRLWAWAAMLVAVILPTSLTIVLVPLVLVLIPTLFFRPRTTDDTKEGITAA